MDAKFQMQGVKNYKLINKLISWHPSQKKKILLNSKKKIFQKKKVHETWSPKYCNFVQVDINETSAIILFDCNITVITIVT